MEHFVRTIRMQASAGELAGFVLRGHFVSGQGNKVETNFNIFSILTTPLRWLQHTAIVLRRICESGR